MQLLELDDETAEKELFSLLQEMVNAYPISLSLTLFASIFIKKMYASGLLKQYLFSLREISKSDRVKDIHMYALINDIVSIRFHSPILGKQSSDLWKETLNEMPVKEKQLYLYDLKLIFDTKMDRKALTKEFEEFRLELRGDTTISALVLAQK